MYANSVKY